eukprot:6185316-Pleurochrysis_carterae.AAC.3
MGYKFKQVKQAAASFISSVKAQTICNMWIPWSRTARVLERSVMLPSLAYRCDEFAHTKKVEDVRERLCCSRRSTSFIQNRLPMLMKFRVGERTTLLAVAI